MNQDKKFWTKNDAMLLADTKFSMEEVPVDPFKTTHIR